MLFQENSEQIFEHCDLFGYLGVTQEYI